MNEIVKAADKMGAAKTGALILMEQEVPLGDLERTGIPIDAIVSSQLLINIFEHNTPLHDGAVIIRRNRVAAATCFLPLTDSNEVSMELGTRHRAAIGASEVSDAHVIVVSEETGKISVARGGVLYRDLTPEQLKNMISELLMKDLGWKLLSVAIATTMWFMVISINQPIDTRSYSTTLQLVGEETLTARGLTVANREDLTNTKISIKVKAQRTALDRLSQRQADLISASVDLSDLTYAQDGDTITLPVETSVGGGATGYTVESKVPGSVEIQVETLAAKEFPLEVSLNGEVTEGTHLSTPKLIPETIMVKGAKSAVDSVVAVRLPVNAADAVQQMDLQVKPVAYDKDGNTVSSVTFSVDTVTVSYSLNEAKQVPVQVSVTVSPADGYHLGEITCTPKTISVIGAKEDLAKLNVISLDQIDVSGATSSISRTFQLSDYLPEGVKLEEGSSAVVQVLVHVDRGEEKTVTVSSDQIHLTNPQDGYQYHMPDSISVSINGEASQLAAVEGSDLSGQIDVSVLTEGEHTVSIDWNLPSSITADNSTVTMEVTAVGGDESDTES